jgi:hypothetical protein
MHIYDAQLSNPHPLPKDKIRLFIQQEKQQVLIASFSSINRQPTIGETRSIEFFKGKPEYPITVYISP